MSEMSKMSEMPTKQCIFVNLSGEGCQLTGHTVGDFSNVSGKYVELCKKHYNMIKYCDYHPSTDMFVKRKYCFSKSRFCTSIDFIVMLSSCFKRYDILVNICLECYKNGPQSNPSVETLRISTQLLEN